jgi:serine protease Do
MKGEVVGIHSSIGPQLTHNFHVPISGFRKSWHRLLAGEVWGAEHDDEGNGARLGVSGRTEDDKCVITEVFQGSAAEKAGVRVGDVVLSVDSRPISTFDELKRIVFFKRPGAKMRLTVSRDHQTLLLIAELTRGH